MISNVEIVINRCTSTLCRKTLIMAPGVRHMIEVLETGSETCEHVYDPASSVTLRRDALVVHALWTVGRLIAERGIDPTAHILAESLGFEPGDSVPVAEIPLQLVDVHEHALTWQGVCAARRVAQGTWEAQTGTVTTLRWGRLRWGRIVTYLERWQHYVM